MIWMDYGDDVWWRCWWNFILFFSMMIAMIDEIMMIMKMNMWRLVVWFCLRWEADEDGDAFSMMMEKMRTEEMEMIEEEQKQMMNMMMLDDCLTDDLCYFASLPWTSRLKKTGDERERRWRVLIDCFPLWWFSAFPFIVGLVCWLCRGACGDEGEVERMKVNQAFVWHGERGGES